MSHQDFEVSLFACGASIVYDDGGGGNADFPLPGPFTPSCLGTEPDAALGLFHMIFRVYSTHWTSVTVMSLTMMAPLCVEYVVPEPVCTGCLYGSGCVRSLMLCPMCTLERESFHQGKWPRAIEALTTHQPWHLLIA